MIGIFGIFIAIFSFVVIGANTALSIQPTGLLAVGTILLIFVLIAFVIAFLLCLIKKWFMKEQPL